MADFSTPNRLARAIALETGADIRTVTAWLYGETMTELVHWALDMAAKKLGCQARVEAIRAAHVEGKP